MTRKDLKKIVFKTHSPLTVEEVMFAIDKYVEQIRAEVIDECKALFRKYILTKEIEGLDELLEQLKEQK